MRAAFESGTTEGGADGTRLAFATGGSGEPLFLVAGQGSDRHAWGFAGDYTDRYQVIVSDHRGTGLSDSPRHPVYTIGGFATDCISILDTLGIGRAHFFGHSMGGRIAQRLCIDHPERVGAVVLASTTPGNRHGVRRSAAIDAAMRTVRDPDERVLFLIDQLFSPAFEATQPEKFVAIRRRLLDSALPPAIALLHYEASEGHEAWAELPDVRAPVLVTHGAEDTLNPTANAHLLAERIPGAELHLQASGRHSHHVEFAAEAGAVVREFLERHPL